MTDQSNTPTPKDGAGKTLFDRGEDIWAESGFKPAPVPRDLAKPVNRRVQQAQKATHQVQSAPEAPRAAPNVSSPVPQTAPEVAPAKAPVRKVQAPTNAIRFGGDIYAVNRDCLAMHGLILPEGPVSGLMEEFRIVKRQVLSAMRKAQAAGDHGRAQRILVCSPLPEEGKTFCAANLAIALSAEKDCEVLLVDADFAKPSILPAFGLPEGEGLMDVLADPAIRIEDCVLSTDIGGLHILPAGHRTTTDSEFLSSNRSEEVLDSMTRGAPNRIVIFDSPPALAASPAAELAHQVGQAIVVARADRTGQSALEDALTLLSACPDIKLLLNAAHFSPSGRRFGAYYGQEA